MLWLRGRDVHVGEEIVAKNHRATMNKSNQSLTSQESSLMSQGSLHSEYSLRSAGSLQSELSIASYNSLASIPSLSCHGIPQPQLQSPHYRCTATMQGHSGHVYSLPMHAVGDENNEGSRTEPTCLITGKHGNGDVKSIAVAGDKIYTAHKDHRIRVWWKRSASDKHNKQVATIPTVKDYLITFMLPKNYVQVRRHRKALWIQHVDSISALWVDAKGFVYSGSWDRTVKIWRPSDFRCVESFRAHDDAINALVRSSDGFLYTGSADARIKVWAKGAEERKHSLVVTLVRHKSAINALALAGNKVLYSGACDRSVIVWVREESAQHMTVAGALRGHTRPVLCLATVADLLFSGSADKTVRVWRRGEGNSHSCLLVLDGHNAPVKSISASVDAATMGCLVYSSSLDRDIKVWWFSSNNINGDSRTPASSILTAPPFVLVL